MTQLSFIGARIPTEAYKWAKDKYKSDTLALNTIVVEAMNADNEAVNTDNQPETSNNYFPTREKPLQIIFDIDRQLWFNAEELVQFMEIESLNELGRIAFKSFIQQRSESASDQVLGFEEVRATENEELIEARKQIKVLLQHNTEKERRISELHKELADTETLLTDTDNKLTEAVNKLTAQTAAPLTDTVNKLTAENATPLTETVNELTTQNENLTEELDSQKIEYSHLKNRYEKLENAFASTKTNYEAKIADLTNKEFPSERLFPILVGDAAKIIMDFENYTQSIPRKLRYRTKEGIVAEFISPDLLPFFQIPKQ